MSGILFFIFASCHPLRALPSVLLNIDVPPFSFAAIPKPTVIKVEKKQNIDLPGLQNKITGGIIAKVEGHSQQKCGLVKPSVP